MGKPRSPAQQAALRKAQLISAAKRHARAHAVGHAPNPENRGKGIRGLKANFTPYYRINKRGTTAGYNAGTILPRGKKRLVVGSYVRVENVNRKGAIDKVTDKAKSRVFPHGTKRAARLATFKNNVKITNPYQVRASYKGHQVRLGTSRGAGPTLIVRKGKHKTPSKVSKKGVNAYNKRVNLKPQKIKKSRPQRRTKARSNAV